MAKVTPSYVTPDATPYIRGRVVFRYTRHGVVAAKWPRKATGKGTPAQIWWRQLFATASHLASSPCWIDQATSEFLVKGTTNVPRDFLTAAALGRLYIIRNPDGTEWPINPHSMPEEIIQEPQEAEIMICWPTVRLNSGYYFMKTDEMKWQGNIFKLPFDMTMNSIFFACNLTVTTAFNMKVLEIDDAGVVLSELASVVQAPVSSATTVIGYPVDLTIPAGTRFAVVYAPIGVAANFQTRSFVSSNGVYPFPVIEARQCGAILDDVTVGSSIAALDAQYINSQGFKMLDFEQV